jgi:1,2-diacylglycerol 3-alpha-glucosyltransferase
MNILMMTNTYLPHVGGVANSVSTFTRGLQNKGHRVVVVAPEYTNYKHSERDVLRIPAIQHFNGSDFSVVLPVPVLLESHLENFKPDIVHSHHPFLIGSAAVRISMKYNVPLVYTQHTMFEEYTQYVPVGLERLKPFVINLSTGYANMSDEVIAPSESIAKILKKRGVSTPMEIIPTGIDLDRFAKGDGETFRKSHKIPLDAFVAGHIGRLAPEKNLVFLSEAIALFLKNEQKAHCMIVGYGSSEQKMNSLFVKNNLNHRVHFLGKLQGQELVDAYHAMDIFVFSSKSETQGLVLVEAMAAGVPVIALDAPGVREVVQDGFNGYLLLKEDREDFVRALKKFCNISDVVSKEFKVGVKKTAENFSTNNCISKLLSVYEELRKENNINREKDESVWRKSINQLKAEWELFSNLTSAVGNTI